jgi:hypothetical protein
MYGIVLRRTTSTEKVFKSGKNRFSEAVWKTVIMSPIVKISDF